MSSMAQQREINELKVVVQRYHERITDLEHRVKQIEAKPKPGRPPKEAANG